jgi:branched-chain amino acid:cation transporter, LIVCS family
MSKFFDSKIIITTGLAIFSMFFGAGNLMFPIMVGLVSADKNIIGITGFMITAVILPTLGLIAMILFDGDYETFFGRLGNSIGNILIFFAMLVIGPLIAMPRIVTLSYVMMEPFLFHISLPLFSALFIGLTFLATAKESKIVNILGYVISPALLISLLIIIIKGFITGEHTSVNTQNILEILWNNIKYGYKTLDLLGGIFFASIVLSILQKDFMEKGQSIDKKKLAVISLKSGVIGTLLLGLIYLGLSYLGAYFGEGLGNVNEGELFSAISFRVLGNSGALIISTAVLMACFSTIIALAAVVAEYLQHYIFKEKVSYIKTLLITLIATFITSNFGLGAILKFSSPVIDIGYPIFITITLCNLAYKLFDFKPIKVPVLLTLVMSLIAYFK